MLFFKLLQEELFLTETFKLSHFYLIICVFLWFGCLFVCSVTFPSRIICHRWQEIKVRVFVFNPWSEYKAFSSNNRVHDTERSLLYHRILSSGYFSYLYPPFHELHPLTSNLQDRSSIASTCITNSLPSSALIKQTRRRYVKDDYLR